MMEKRWNIALMPAGLAIALAGSLVFAQMRSGAYGSANAARMGQAAMPGFAPDAKYDVGPYSSLTPELAEGEGRHEVQSFSATCHSTRYVTMQTPLPPPPSEPKTNKTVKA